MFSLFKRKPKPEEELTFKARVQRFWKWFATEAPRLHTTIEAGQCRSLGAEISSKVGELSPGMAWVFGPGEAPKSHSLTVSGEGILHLQLLTQYWCSQAPKIDGWVFHPARQPGLIGGACIKIGEHKFDALALWVTPSVDHDHKRINLTVWHPLFAKLDERARWTPVFLFLDELLGEFETQQWIGEIKLHDQRLADAMPLKELPSLIQKLRVDNGWKKLPPGEEAVVYNMKEPHQRFLRGDVIAGATVNFGLIQDYLSSEGEFEDPIPGTGADYVFVSFDSGVLPHGEEATARGKIEDALDAALKEEASGRVLGGAFGTQFAYIDLLVFDGNASLNILKRVLNGHNVPAGSSLNYFAKEKRGHRILL